MSTIQTRLFWPLIGVMVIGFYSVYDYQQKQEEKFKRQQEISWLVQLSSEQDPLLRISAVGRMAKERPVVQEVKLALIKALMDKEPQVRMAAARALGAIGTIAGNAPVAALENSLNDENPDVRVEIASALEKITGKTVALNSDDQPDNKL